MYSVLKGLRGLQESFNTEDTENFHREKRGRQIGLFREITQDFEEAVRIIGNDSVHACGD